MKHLFYAFLLMFVSSCGTSESITSEPHIVESTTAESITSEPQVSEFIASEPMKFETPSPTAHSETSLISPSAVASTSQNSTSQPLRIAIISDLNGPYGTIDYDWHVDSTVAKIVAIKPDIVLLSGDMIAGQDTRLPDDRFPQMWAEFDKRVGKPLRDAGIPLGFSIGNHDGSPSDPFNRERVATRAHWDNPAHHPQLDFVDRGDYPFYFSYRAGNAFFVSWDASSANITESTLDWVEEQLQSDVAQNASFRVIVGHLPLYAAAVGRNRRGEILRNSNELLAVMQKYDVNLYVSGHHHAYYPGHRGGVDLMQTGALGGGPRQLLRFGEPPRKTWTMLKVDVSNPSDVELTYTTWDVDSGKIIQNHELPRYLHGLTGFTVRRDLPQSQEFFSEWIGMEADGFRPTGHLSGKVIDENIELSMSFHQNTTSSHSQDSQDSQGFETLRWALHTWIDSAEESDTLASGRFEIVSGNRVSSENIDRNEVAEKKETDESSKFATKTVTLPKSTFDSDGLRGGIYYVSLYREGTSGVDGVDNNGNFAFARARLMPKPNNAPASISAEEVKMELNGNQLKISWPRVYDADGDGVFYEVRLISVINRTIEVSERDEIIQSSAIINVSGISGAAKAVQNHFVGPQTEITITLPDITQTYFLSIRATDGALFSEEIVVTVRY